MMKILTIILLMWSQFVTAQITGLRSIMQGPFGLNPTMPFNTQDYGFDVVRDGYGGWHTTYDWNSIKYKIHGQQVWIDPVNGNNANSGTKNSPKKSIHWVIDNFDASNPIIVNLTPGWYNYPDAFNGADIDRPIRFVCPDGIAYVTTSDTLSQWSVHSGNVYGGHYLGTAGLEASEAADFTNLDAYGLPVRLTAVSSIAEVESTPGSVYAIAANDSFYVRLWDDRAPDSDFHIFFEKNAVESFDDSNIYFENIYFMGGGSGKAIMHFDNTANTNIKTVVRKNCTVWGSFNDDNSAIFDYVHLYDTACIYAYGYKDGNDADENSFVLEVDCKGVYNGWDGVNDANNGSTFHATAKGVRLRGEYTYNGGRNVHDIEEAVAYNIQCVAGHSRGTGTNYWAYSVGGVTSTTAANYYIDCTAVGTYGWQIQANGTGFFFNTNYSSMTNAVVGIKTELTGYVY